MELVFIDTETTGLDYNIHGLIELAWAYETGPIRSFVVDHRHLMEQASPKALEVNRYHERGYADMPTVTDEQLDEFLDAVEGNQIVGANVRFDARMIQEAFDWYSEPWHYRLFDFSAWASGRLGWDRVKGMREITERVKSLGYDVPTPDHSAAGDVDAMRAMFHIIRHLLSVDTVAPTS